MYSLSTDSMCLNNFVIVGSLFYISVFLLCALMYLLVNGVYLVFLSVSLTLLALIYIFVATVSVFGSAGVSFIFYINLIFLIIIIIALVVLSMFTEPYFVIVWCSVSIFMSIFFSLLDCNGSVYLNYVIMESFVLLSIFVILLLDNSSKGSLIYVIVSVVSSLLFILGLSLVSIDSNFSSIVFIVFFCLKSGVLPFGLWVKFFYNAVSLPAFFAYMLTFYSQSLFFAALIVNNLISSLYVIFFFNIFLVFSSLFLGLFLYSRGGNVCLSSLFVSSTWFNSILVFVLLF